MDPIEQENALLEQRIAQLEATLTQPQEIQPASNQGSLANALATGVGGAINLGDILTFGQLSKGIAAVPAISRDIYGLATGAEPQDYYTEELAKVNALKNLYAQQREAQGLSGLETALSFMAPVPGGKAEAFTSVARPLKEAGLGLAAYTGSEVGEALTGGQGGAIVGALAAPLTIQGAVGFGRRVLSTLDEPRALLRGDEAAIQNAAVQEILDRAGPEGAARIALAQELQTPLMSPLGVPMTAAEVAQTPSLATYQYAMSKPEMGGQTLLDALAQRKEEQALAFGALATQPQKGQLSEALRTVAAQQGVLKADEAIKGIDLDLASRNPAAMEEPSRLVQSLGTEVISEIKTAAKDAKEAGRSAFKDPAVYNVVVDVPNIKQDVNRIVRGWKRDPSQRIGDATVLSQIKRLRQLDMPKEDLPEGFVPSVKIGELHDIQVQLGKVLSSTKQGERTPSQALALNLYKYIESVMENAPGSDALFAAKDKWKNYFDTFVYDKERGVISPLKQALKKSPEKVVPFLSSESASLGALKKAGVGAQQIETQKLSEFMNLPTAEKKLAWITKNRPALSEADFWPSIENAEQTLKATLEPGQLSEFVKVSEGQIPSQIFSDLGKARRFMKDVEGTQLEDLTRGKFIESLQTGRGTIADRLASQRDVAKTIFKGDYDRLKTIIDDIEGAASPERLKQLATGKQSITSQSQTTLGAIMNKRSLLRLAQNSKYISGIIGTTAGAAGPGGWLGGILVGGVAQAGAMKLGKKAEAVEERLNTTIAEMLAKPELIKFAEAPPTVKNVESFFKQASRLGYFGARATPQEQTGDRIMFPSTEAAATRIATDPEQGVVYEDASEAVNRIRNTLRENQGSDAFLGGKAIDEAELDALLKANDIGMLIDNKTFIPGSIPPANVDLSAAREIKFNVKRSSVEPTIATSTPATPNDLDAENTMLEQRIMELEKALNTPVEAKVGKQNINAMLDEIPREFGINPKWVKAIAKIESDFNPDAIGPKTKYGRAEGLVQLMPATAKALGVKNSFDPKQAITGASKLLVELEDTYGKYKEPMLLFAAYNSRPETVNAAIRKVKKENKPVTWENVSKYMPKETQRYVDKVLSLV